jgi:multidrug efflux pump subunit AcrB
MQSEPARIDRLKRERTVTVTSRTENGFLTSRVSNDVFKQLEALSLPPGYRIAAGGQAEAQARSFGGLGGAILLALFGIMAVLILEFRSFKTSSVVAGVIPLGVIGGLVGLWVTGYPLAFTAVIGFIALIGIEIKNSILLVDFTEQLREEGVPLREAIEQAGHIRFLPVLLTSATAIGGLLPLALEGSGLYSPLAIVIIAGLISSTLLSRLVTPVMYLLLAEKDPVKV